MADPTPTLFTRPPAKVNLTLEVGPRREDGYHDLRTVMLRLGLADRLTARLADEGKVDRLAVVGFVECPVEGNLVLRAMDVLRERLPDGLPVLEFGLEKRIPLGRGLGGGSSDAAATMDLAMGCWGTELSDGERLAAAGRIGSDVFFFARGVPSALVEGRGEHVAPMPEIAGGAGVLLALPPYELNTGEAYARHDEMGSAAAERGVTTELVDALASGLDGAALAEWAPRLRDANDLWPAAVAARPELSVLRDTLERLTGRPWLMSGSGSTLFALYASAGDAAEAGDSLAAELETDTAGLTLVADDLLSPDPAWRYP
jgi:4-diphosphocytidyl-2-C-methyl-D-erythritol kinase